MKCPKCNAEIPNGAGFCGNCGEDLSSDNIINTLEESAAETAPKKSKERAAAPKNKNKKKTEQTSGEQQSKKKGIKVKIVLAVILVIAVLAAVLWGISYFGTSEGEKVLKNVPIGRDIAYAETKTGKDFTTVSKYDSMKELSSFGSICEADNGIKVEGTHVPEWAVTVSLAADNTIDRVTYYDFSQLQKTWKGHHESAEISVDAVEYGMSEKEVERKLGFKPYTIIKGIDNTSTYVYRYYYSDEMNGNDVVVNYFVVFNDIDGSVKNVYASKLSYNAFMLSVN